MPSKECYAKHREALLAYQRQYRQRPEVKVKLKEYRKKYRVQSKKTHREWRKKHPEKSGEYSKKWYYKYREEIAQKNRAYYYDNIEKRDAKNLARVIPLGSKCEVCESKSHLEKHHPDYSKPLEITTVCSSCHKMIHMRE